MEKVTLSQLILQVRDTMNYLRYPENHIKRNMRIWEKFQQYSQKHSQECFSEELGERYLKETYNYPYLHTGRMPDSIQRGVRAIRMLGDYQQHGHIRRSSRRPDPLYPTEFNEMMEQYGKRLLESGLSVATVKNRKAHTGHFLAFIHIKKKLSLLEVDAQLISNYVASLTGYANSTMGGMLSNLRGFLEFLFETGRIKINLSLNVPPMKRDFSYRLPSTWTEEEVRALLAAVDRGSPIGKRDYAIMLLITRLGLRRSDAENLKLNQIDWEKCCVEFVQIKTKRPLLLPMPEDVGEAIIDYLRYGRPQTNAETLFVQHVPPYYGSICAGNIMAKYITLSGVNIENKRHGLHILRHTLASRLLEQHVPVHLISDILGHANIYSTNDYLHLNLEQLKQCAIEVGEVSFP